jgi:hypothetical protein
LLAWLIPVGAYFGMAKMGRASEVTSLLVVNLGGRHAGAPDLEVEPSPSAADAAAGGDGLRTKRGGAHAGHVDELALAKPLDSKTLKHDSRSAAVP